MSADNVVVADIDAAGHELERVFVERYRTALRECVRSLPVSDDDGLWIKTQVLRFIEATTVAELEEAVPAAFSRSATAAAAFNTAAPEKSG